MGKIDFDSDRIVFIFYQGGACGELINRLLLFSKEIPVFLDPPVSFEEMFIFHFENRGIELTSANCHGTDVIWIDHPENEFNFPYGFTDLIPIKSYIEENSNERFIYHQNKTNVLFIFRVHEIKLPKQIFPNSKTISIIVSKGKNEYFKIRAWYEKLIKSNRPEHINNRQVIYKIIKYNSSFDVSDNKFKLSLQKILSCDRDEYHKLCKYLNITPSEHYEKLITEYMKVQWKRKKVGD